MSEQKNDEIIDIEPQIINDAKAEEAPLKRVLPMRRFAVGAISGLAFAIAGGWVYRDLLVNYLPSEQMQILAHKVEALEATNNDNLKRVDAVVALTEELKAKLGAAQASADKSAKLNGEATQQVQQDALLLSQLQADLTDVKTKLAAGAGTSSGGTDVALAARVDALEKATSAAKTQAPAESAMSLQPALAVLKAKLDAGDPYADALVPFRLVVSKTAGLDALKMEAERGLPNANQLAQEMAKLKATLGGATASRPSEGWGAWASRLLSGIVTIKTKNGSETLVLASKAEAFAASGDLSQASELLVGAGESLPETLAQWRDKVQRRVAVEKAFDALASAVQQVGK